MDPYTRIITDIDETQLPPYTNAANTNRMEDDFHAGCRTSVSTNNSPFQDYTNPHDQPTTNILNIY